MKRKIFALIMLGSMLVGCAQEITSIKKDSDKPLTDKTGYLLLSVDTNVTLDSIIISGKKTLKLTTQDLQQGSNYIIVDIPAGNYQIDRVKFSKYYYLEMDDSHWDFIIEPKKINYIGNFNIETSVFLLSSLRAKTILENRSTQALQFLEKNFPKIINNRKLHYAGPGTDSFFEYARQLLNKE